MDISKDLMSTSQKKKIAKLLKVSPEMYEQFEKSYRDNILSDNESVFSQDRFDNDHSLLMRFKKMRGEQADGTSSITVEKYIDLLSDKIINELIERTERYVYDGENGYYDRPKKTDTADCCENDNYLTAPVKRISSEDIYCLPKELRPQLTGYLMQKDYDDISASSLLVLYDRYLKTHDKRYYYSFRQGLDFIDLDEIVYEMLGMNRSNKYRMMLFPQKKIAGRNTRYHFK